VANVAAEPAAVAPSPPSEPDVVAELEQRVAALEAQVARLAERLSPEG
jgi:uncharacterized protein YceH (UPF0502 family)